MRPGIYMTGVISVALLLALGLQLLPPPWQGGIAGWFGALWFLGALAAGLGYWRKYDKAKARQVRQRKLAEARERQTAKRTELGRRQRSY